MLAYNIVEDEEVKSQMGRRIIKPNYDIFVEFLQEMPQEDKERFIQKLLGVDSIEEAILKLTEAKEQQTKESEK